MVLPLLILFGLLIIAYVVYIAVIYWYITLPIIGFIVFILHGERIGKWIGKKRYNRYLASQIKKREKQAKIILEQKRIKDLKLQQLEAQIERNFWNGISKQFEDIELHLTGPLQTNKTKEAIKLFDIFHTLDREKLAKEFVKHGGLENKKFFVQVNTGKEESKSGIYMEE